MKRSTHSLIAFSRYVALAWKDPNNIVEVSLMRAHTMKWPVDELIGAESTPRDARNLKGFRGHQGSMMDVIDVVPLSITVHTRLSPFKNPGPLFPELVLDDVNILDDDVGLLISLPSCRAFISRTIRNSACHVRNYLRICSGLSRGLIIRPGLY